MDDVRRTYQRAIAVPLSNVEQIWREYDAYENGLNRVTVSFETRFVVESLLTIDDAGQEIPRRALTCIHDGKDRLSGDEDPDR